jgi:hypothetical protein
MLCVSVCVSVSSWLLHNHSDSRWLWESGKYDVAMCNLKWMKMCQKFTGHVRVFLYFSCFSNVSVEFHISPPFYNIDCIGNDTFKKWKKMKTKKMRKIGVYHHFIIWRCWYINNISKLFHKVLTMQDCSGTYSRYKQLHSHDTQSTSWQSH